MSNIYFGNSEIGAVYDATSQIWPTAFYATLSVAWTYGGDYDLVAMPAGGGTATAVWTIHIFNESQEVESHVVTPSSVALTDVTNFGYANGVWTANDRGRNGLPSSEGTTRPQNAPARNCGLSATASYTMANDVTVTASYQTTMTQNANNVTAGTSQYVNFRFSIQNDKWTYSNPGDASRNSATMSAAIDQKTPYTFDSGSLYNFMVYNAATTTDFNYTSDSWLSFSGATATMSSRGTTYDAYRRSAVINCSLHGIAQGNLTVYQAPNIYADTYTRYNDYFIYTYPYSLDSDDTSFVVRGQLYYQEQHKFSSGEYDAWADAGYTTVTPTVTNVVATPSVSGISYTGNTVHVPANTSGDDIEYTAYANYTDPDGGTWNNYSTSITQSGVVYTYGTPVVSFSYPEIPAYGGTVYPVVSFSQSRSWPGGSDTIHGELDEGYTHGYADDGSYFSVTFYGNSASPGTFYSSDGRVYIGSRGTTPGEERNAATSCRAYVSCNGHGAYSSYTSAIQEANIEEVTPASNNCSSLSISFSPSSIPNAGTTWVSIVAKASGTEVTERKDYSSGEHTGGVSTSYSNRTVALDWLKVNGVSQSDTDGFTASNIHSLSSASYSVEGAYGDNERTASKSITQPADSQSGWLTKDYVVSISITRNTVNAAGGTATMSASGSHTRYKQWSSDGAVVDGSTSTISDTPSLSLVSMSSSGAFSLSGSTVTHRDMANNATTDSVRVRATNGSATDETETISATNSKSYGAVVVTPSYSTIPAAGTPNPITFSAASEVTWTSGYPEADYDDFSFSIRSKGNSSWRTYTLSGDSLTVSSLGTHVNNNTAYTYIKATAALSAVGSGEAILTEAPNIVESTDLEVVWNITGAPIPAVGGTARVGVSSAAIVSTYSSGATGSSSVDIATILNNTTASGTGFTYTHSYTAVYATVRAVVNETGSERSCTLTTSYQGKTVTTDIDQPCVAYRTKTEINSGIVGVYIRNADGAAHTFTYVITRNGTADSPVTANFSANEGWRQVGGMPAQAGNIITIDITAQDGGTIIRS